MPGRRVTDRFCPEIVARTAVLPKRHTEPAAATTRVDKIQQKNEIQKEKTKPYADEGSA